MKNLTDYFSKNIQGKRIVLTGGTTGIGRATADMLIAMGGRVLTFGRDEEDFNQAFEEIRAKYPDCELYGSPIDITKKEDTDKIFDLIDSSLGGIDILVNNAALAAEGVTEGSFE